MKLLKSSPRIGSHPGRQVTFGVPVRSVVSARMLWLSALLALPAAKLCSEPSSPNVQSVPPVETRATRADANSLKSDA